MVVSKPNDTLKTKLTVQKIWYHYISFKNDQSKILLQYFCQFKDKCPSILYCTPAHLDQCQQIFPIFSVAKYLYQSAINAPSSVLFQYFLYLFILNCCFCPKYRRFYYINDATLQLQICRFYGSEAMVIHMHTYTCHLLPNLYFGTSSVFRILYVQQNAMTEKHK